MIGAFAFLNFLHPFFPKICYLINNFIIQNNKGVREEL